eukprot:GHVP01069800.1.p1 GENE.GHVP01069800.1~~GHVP01069800.1.p1  ORF type:complete len:852 (-),score=154.83 GHVP01069800.1:349-2904(-)
MEKESKENIEKEDQVKTTVDLIVTRIADPSPAIQLQAIEALKKQLIGDKETISTSSKVIQYIERHFIALQDIYSQMRMDKSLDLDLFASILSYLSISYMVEESHLALYYHLEQKNKQIGEWGHTYVNCVALEFVKEFKKKDRSEWLSDEKIEELLFEILRYFFAHNSEPDAIDLAIEFDRMPVILEFIDSDNYLRTALYLQAIAKLECHSDRQETLGIVRQVYLNQGRYCDAVAISLEMQNTELILEDLNHCPNDSIKTQMYYIISKQLKTLDHENDASNPILGNQNLSEHFLKFAKDFGIDKPIHFEDVYKRKSQPEPRGGRSVIFDTSKLDSTKMSLSNILVNGFVNLGYCSDKMLLENEEDANSNIFSTKGPGIITSVSTIGLLLKWNLDEGIKTLIPYITSTNSQLCAGGLLGLGALSSGVKTMEEPVLAITVDKLNSGEDMIKASAILGLGMSYAGTNKKELIPLLIPYLAPGSQLSPIAALSLGHIFIGTGNEEVIGSILQYILECSEEELKLRTMKSAGIGLGLLCYNNPEKTDVITETLSSTLSEESYSKFASLVIACGYAGTGDLSKIQETILRLTERSLDSVVSLEPFIIAAVAFGTDLDNEMALKLLLPLIQTGKKKIKKVALLSIGLLYASRPDTFIQDILSKYSHDGDKIASLCAIFAMGIVGAGTRNAKMLQDLRSLATYYQKDCNTLAIIRVSQGLINLGKGVFSLNPCHLDGNLVSPVRFAGLFTTLVMLVSPKKMMEDSSFFLLFLSLAINPRFLVTIDNNTGEQISIPVRVGQAVDCIGQVGKPRRIAAPQTNNTPILLNMTEKAEMGNGEYKSLCNVLEGFIIVEKQNGDGK